MPTTRTAVPARKATRPAYIRCMTSRSSPARSRMTNPATTPKAAMVAPSISIWSCIGIQKWNGLRASTTSTTRIHDAIISFIVLGCNSEYFFYGQFEKTRDLEREQNRRRIMPLLDGDNGLSADAHMLCEFLLGNAGLRPEHLHCICNIGTHGDTQRNFPERRCQPGFTHLVPCGERIASVR